MWYEFLKFELKYRFLRAETYAFFLQLLLFSLVGVEFVFQGIDLGPINKNAPIVIAKTMGAISGLSLFLVSMVMGVPVLRDSQYETAALLYATPIRKRDYLLGKFAGSLIITIIIFSALPLGMMLAEALPWARDLEYPSFNMIHYLQPFVTIVLPIMLFGSSVFFITGALSKSLMVVYSQGIVIFVLFILTKAITNETLQGLLDPFSLTTLTDMVRDWSAQQKNSQLIPLYDLLLANKLLWMGIGFAIFFFGLRNFKWGELNNLRARKIIVKKVLDKSNLAVKPKISANYKFSGQLLQVYYTSIFHTRSILKQPAFWAIVLCALVIIVINSVSLGTTYGVNSYPTSYLILEELLEMSIYFLIVILLFYSAETMWKERAHHLNLMVEATPIGNLAVLLGKSSSLLSIYLVLIVSLIFAGILLQSAMGYFQFDLKVYLVGFLLELFPFLIVYTTATLFFQTLTGRKYLGILMTILFMMINVGISVFGVSHGLVNFGGSALEVYSEMNGYGHYLVPFLWVKSYWLLGSFVILLISSILLQRGLRPSVRRRWILGSKLVGIKFRTILIASLCLMICVGAYIYYNTNILNEYWSEQKQQSYRAAYEKDLKFMEYFRQPLITDVSLNVEIYPSERSYEINGEYLLTNPHNQPIHELHIQKCIDESILLERLEFNRPGKLNDKYSKYEYWVYVLDSPMLPFDTIEMSFLQLERPKGFSTKFDPTEVIHNGTFFDNTILPTLGYQKKYELKDHEARAARDLQPYVYRADRNDRNELLNSRSGSDAHRINYEVIIGTESSQTAITSGELLEKWSKNNRNYFHYKTDQRIINFFPIVSAKYYVIKEDYAISTHPDDTISLEIYHHPSHTYNLDRMLFSMKQSLAYYSEHFSPYQYGHLRIMEFPRYRQFAQSFPGVIPYSEALGFILDINDEEDVDMVFFITAHEIAHQWWGMQLQAANVKGKNMILETLSQYSALMVLKSNYPCEKVDQFLGLQQEKYTDGLRRSRDPEVPLSLVENQEYLYYAKGALAMFELQELIGEAEVNRALQAFLKKWSDVESNKRYATTEDLMYFLKEASPDDLREKVVTMLETTDPS